MKIMLTRRAAIIGLSGMVTMPAIVRHRWLMRLSRPASLEMHYRVIVTRVDGDFIYDINRLTWREVKWTELATGAPLA